MSCHWSLSVNPENIRKLNFAVAHFLKKLNHFFRLVRKNMNIKHQTMSFWGVLKKTVIKKFRKCGYSTITINPTKDVFLRSFCCKLSQEQ